MAFFMGNGLPNPWNGDETVQPELKTWDATIDNPMVPTSTGLTQVLGNEQAQQEKIIRTTLTVCLILSLIVLGALADRLYFGNRSTVLPYVIEVAVPDAEPGQVRGIRALPAPQVVQLTDNMAVWFINRWIKDTHWLHDKAVPQAQTLQWEGAFMVTENSMHARLKIFIDGQIQRMQQGETVEVKPKPGMGKAHTISVLPIAARERSYKAEWVEMVWGMSGQLLRKELWEATLVLSQRVPARLTEAEQDAWDRNPAGLFVHEFSWDKRILCKGDSCAHTHP